MSTHDMSDKELEQVWKMMLKDTFDQFITAQLGYDAEGRPVCFGSGDGKDYCTWCQFQPHC